MLNGTPVYDIKPYLPFVDSHLEATGGFAARAQARLRVEFPETLLQAVPERAREALKALLARDPRPSYQHDPERLYGLPFASVNVRFHRGWRHAHRAKWGVHAGTWRIRG